MYVSSRVGFGAQLAAALGTFILLALSSTAAQAQGTCVGQDDTGCDAGYHCESSICLADLSDGASCDESSDCQTSYCANGFCCGGPSTTCCAVASHCPAAFASAPLCDDAMSCQGTRLDKACLAFQCDSVVVEDDSACGVATFADACGDFEDAFCTGSPIQDPMVCSVSCTTSLECDPTAECIAGVCEVPVVAMFQGLGDFAGGLVQSRAFEVSADGSTVVGEGFSASGGEAFVWTATSGMQGLGFLPGHDSSNARAASADGSTVVGVSGFFGSSEAEAFVWDATNGMQGLGDLPGGIFQSIAQDVSADGSVVVGLSVVSGGNIQEPAESYEPFIWDATNGMVSLGDLGGMPVTRFGGAAAISSDGLIVVGSSDSPSGREAFLWDAINGMVGLGDLPGGTFESGASSITPDGTRIVGRSRSGSGGGSNYEVLVWDSTNGMQGLGDLPGGTFQSAAADIAADASVIVGWSTGVDGEEAFVWDPANGMRTVVTVLRANGVIVPVGWKLTIARAVSDDGTVIVGEGINPSGDTEAWMAVLPTPAAVVPVPWMVVPVGGLLLLSAARRYLA